MKTPPAKSFFPGMSGMSLCLAFRHRLTSLWHRFFGTIALMEFVLKNPCQQLCSFSLAPCQRSNACPMAQGLQTLAALGCTVFRNNLIDEICPEKPVPTAVEFECCPLPTKLCMSHRSTFANHLKSLGRTVFRDNRIDGICPENPCQELCFSVRRFLPTELSPSYFPRFPFRPPCRHSRIAPSHRSSPRAISHGFSFPPELSPSYFTWFPFRPPYRQSSIAPSHRTSPQAISHGFPSVHPVVTPVSLLPTGALPKLFPTVSLPSTLSSLPYRSFPPELSPSYFSQFPHRLSPHAISHGFPPVHSLVASVSLLLTGALPKLFPMVSRPSTISSSLLPPRSSPQAFPTVSPPCTLLSLPSRSFPPDLSPSYFPRLPLRPHYRASKSLLPNGALPKAISHGFAAVHPLITPASLLPTGTFSPCYFPRFPLCPPSRNPAPFRTEPPQAISHGFHSVHRIVASVSLLPNGALPKLFRTRPPCRHSRIAPSHRGALPKLFPTVSLLSTLSSLPYRSFPPAHRSSPQAISHGFPSVHPVYFPRFPLRPPNRCFHPFPPNGALPKLFHTVSLPSTLSSLPYRSFPPELSPKSLFLLNLVFG